MARSGYGSYLMSRRQGGPAALELLQTEGERRLEVVPRVGAEGDVGLGGGDTGDLVEPVGDDVRDVLVG